MLRYTTSPLRSLSAALAAVSLALVPAAASLAKEHADVETAALLGYQTGP